MTGTGRRGFFAELIKPATAANTMTCRTGAHGERVGLLGFGMMRFPTTDGKHSNPWAAGSSNAPIDQELVNREVRYALERGVNYFDTAPVYCRGQSEEVTGKALAASGFPRAKYHIATKLSNFAKNTRSAEASQGLYRASMKNLRTDYFDFYLLHSIGSIDDFRDRFIANGMMDFLMREREAGRIRNLGFSFHGSADMWRWAMEAHAKYHWDFVQIQLNWVDWLHAPEVNARNLPAAQLVGDLAKRGIRAVVMEPLLGGRLARLDRRIAAKLAPLDPGATDARWAFRFAATPENVLTVLSGMTWMEHIEENANTYSPHKPVTERERAVLEEAACMFLAGDSVPCTACDYCMPCPYGLDIPGIFGCFNANRESSDAKFLADYMKNVPKLRRAERCTGCGRCMPHCPQSIDIVAEMRRIDKKIETIRTRETN